MKYNEIFNLYFFVSIIILVLFITYKSRLNIIISIDINDNNKLINLNIKYLFNLLNIRVQLYPPKKSKKKKVGTKHKRVKVKKGKIKLFSYEIIKIYKVISNVKVNELYSNISFGNKNIYFTCFIFLFINIIYGNFNNLINAEKIYLNVEPNFLDNYINAKVKIHISPKIEDLFKIYIVLIQSYIKNKDGVRDESNRVNTKSYGDNS